MIKRYLALALVVGMWGCAPEADRDTGGGGGDNLPANRVVTEETRPEAAGNQLALQWGTTITGDERNYADAYTRATWVHANLVGEEWEQAGEDLAFIEDELTDLLRSTNVPPTVRARIGTLQPTINTLAKQILDHDRKAIETSRSMVTAFTNITSDAAVSAWMGEANDRQGGGAGAGDNPVDHNRMNDTP